MVPADRFPLVYSGKMGRASGPDSHRSRNMRNLDSPNIPVWKRRTACHSCRPVAGRLGGAQAMPYFRLIAAASSSDTSLGVRLNV
ncbi:hypothetical protein HD596_004376 [Nonomuraea jabiensis]|uniref:Uncharacterized protein n=1 Tax=Nonomuraea jabiensis TaxID=882448 RepID=A0A7W9G5I7_9ACTN|nr:hypothetical protein [Nonomuraea jabiensis]